MRMIRLVSLFTMLGGLAACNFPGFGGSRVTPIELPTQIPTSVPSTDALIPSPLPTTTSPPVPAEPSGPEEAILILEPGPGSRVVSPIRVAGVADPTFEQNLVIRIVLDDGTEVVVQPVTIAADLGQRGPFEGEVSFNVADDRQALIQVYDVSARDGGVTHLASVGVRLSPSPPAEILPNEPRPEAISIQEPAFGAIVSGGVAHVEGFGLASFEQTLVIEVQDLEGNVVGSVPIIVNAPDWGVPGTFSADVPYSASSEGPGRIVVIDPLPAFDGIGHISSVEITLAP